MSPGVQWVYIYIYLGVTNLVDSLEKHKWSHLQKYKNVWIWLLKVIDILVKYTNLNFLRKTFQCQDLSKYIVLQLISYTEYIFRRNYTGTDQLDSPKYILKLPLGHNENIHLPLMARFRSKYLY